MAELKLVCALVNFAISIAIAGVAMCRINGMPPDTPNRRAAPYAMLLGAAVASACSPWLGHLPGVAHVMSALAVFLLLVVLRPGLRTRKT